MCMVNCCSNDKDAAVKLVNDWVSENTNKKIKDIVPSSAVDALTRLILVNAIYFKGDWNKKFDTSLTKDDDFKVSDTKKVDVKLMYMNKGKVKYGVSSKLNSQAIELPYVGEELSMFVILPDANASNIDKLQKELTVYQLNNIEKEFHMMSATVNIWLPRFKLEESLNLGASLSRLGIEDLFVENIADLSGMDGTKDLYVSKVLHKAFVEVNEEGTEAAAATTVVVRRKRALTKECEFDFRADHPFLFIIPDNRSRAILFMGRLAEP